MIHQVNFMKIDKSLQSGTIMSLGMRKITPAEAAFFSFSYSFFFFNCRERAFSLEKKTDQINL